MPMVVNLNDAREMLQVVPISLSQYFWNDIAQSRSHNIMVLTDYIRDAGMAPFPNIVEFSDSDLFKEYVHLNRVWIRTERPNFTKLLHFLRVAILNEGHKRALLLTFNDSEYELKPDPWLPDWGMAEHTRQPSIDEQLDALGIRPGLACGILCDLPSELPTVGEYASWFWRREENLYIFCDDNVRIVICHEGDIHFCSLDEDYIIRICSLAERNNLFIAPFDSQQCN